MDDEVPSHGKGAIRTLPIIRKEDLDRLSSSDSGDELTGLEMPSEAPRAPDIVAASSFQPLLYEETEADLLAPVAPVSYQQGGKVFFLNKSATTCVISLSHYGEAFMRTDLLEPIETRAVSETMLESIKHHMKVKGYLRPLTLHLRVPAARRRPEIEQVLAQRLRDVAEYRFRLAISTIIKDVCIGITYLVVSFLLLWLSGHMVAVYSDSIWNVVFFNQIVAVAMWYVVCNQRRAQQQQQQQHDRLIEIARVRPLTS